MRHLVLGGTGFIGTPLVKRLQEQGEELAILSRGEKPIAPPAGVTVIRGDRFALEEAAAEIDAFGPESIIDVLAMDVEKDPAVFAFFSERVGRYTLLSSCDVYQVMGRLLGTESGDPLAGMQDETSPLRQQLYPYRNIMPDIRSAYDKIPLERACLEDFAFEGTVLRLPMIYGPGDRQHRWRDVVAHLHWCRPAILYPKSYAGWTTTYGYIENVAAAIACAATHDAACGEIFNVADENSLTQQEWAEAFGRAFGWEGEVVTADPEALPEKRANFAKAGNLEQDLRIKSAKIRTCLGFEPEVSCDEAMALTIAYEQQSFGDLPPEAYDFAADDAFLAGRRG